MKLALTFISIFFITHTVFAQTMTKDTIRIEDIPSEISKSLYSKLDSVETIYYFKFGAFIYGMEYKDRDYLFVRTVTFSETTELTTYEVRPIELIPEKEIEVLRKINVPVKQLTRSYSVGQRTIYEAVESGQIILTEIIKN